MVAPQEGGLDALGHHQGHCPWPLGALTHGHYDLKAHRPKRVHIVQTELQVLPVR